jgi:hypothetical protein
MEHLPSELLHLIFGLACNDGGFTARSLSLVSRTIREKSRYSRFHSVACHNIAQTLSFARILDETPPHLRVVRHFLVCNSYKDKLPSANSVSKGFPNISSLIWKFPRSESIRPDCSDGPTPTTDLVVHSAVLSILNIIAPTLYTLSMYIDWQSWAFLPLPGNFPLLGELSINHQFAGGCFRSNALSPLRSCPSLRHLIITGFVRIVDPLQVVEQIKQFAPAVTHLCLPYDAKNMTVMFDILKERMVSHHSRCVGNDDAVFPRSLVHVFIHTYNVTLSASFAAKYGPGMMIVDRRWARGPCMVKPHLHWESEWIDGHSGGKGYWKLPDRNLF